MFTFASTLTFFRFLNSVMCTESQPTGQYLHEIVCSSYFLFSTLLIVFSLFHIERWGAEPPHFSSVYTFYTINKITLRRPQKCFWSQKFKIFLWEHAPRSPRWLMVLVSGPWAPSLLQGILHPCISIIILFSELHSLFWTLPRILNLNVMESWSPSNAKILIITALKLSLHTIAFH